MLIASASTPDEIAAMVDRRAAGVPLEHILGWAEFCGLRIAVEPGVFVPRRRTEFLVHQALLIHRATALTRTQARTRTVVVDLCCGSGAVGAALLAAANRAEPPAANRADPVTGRADPVADETDIELYAVDIDPAAVRCARRNLAGRGQVYQGDLYVPLPTTLHSSVDIIVANAPYVPTEEIPLLPPEARVHEPPVALDGGADGLHIVCRLIAEAPQWLAPGGHLLVETSELQAPHAAQTITRHGLLPRIVRSAEHNATVVIATAQRHHPTGPPPGG